MTTFRLILNTTRPGYRTPGHRSGNLVDEAGRTIGSAHDSTYSGRGFAIHTDRFAGFWPADAMTIVDPAAMEGR